MRAARDQPKSLVRCARSARVAAAASACGIAVGLGSLAGAQQAAGGDTLTPVEPERRPGPFDGRAIRKVEILTARPGSDAFVDPAPRDLQFVLNQLRTGKGSREYDERTLADDIVRLSRTGRFGAVEQEIVEHADGSITVRLLIREQPVIRDVQVTGNRRLGSARLAEAIEFLPGTPVDRFELDRAARRLEEIYRERGFYLAEVTVNTEVLDETGVILFEVREGTRVRITGIRFDGNRAFRDSELRDEIETHKAGFFRRGRLDRETLAADARAVARYIQDRGYLDARVDTFVQPSPDGREAIVTYFVEEGPLYTLRDVVVSHADAGQSGPVLAAEQVVGLIGMKPGDTYSVNKVQAAVRTVTDAYGKMGYADVRVERRELRDTTRPEVDLLLLVREGARYRTGLVQIAGNTLTNHAVVRNEIRVKPDRPLDVPAVRESERILQATRLFEPQTSPPRAVIQQPDPGQPTHRDVLVEVTETNTGLLSLGAGVGSDAGVTGRLSYEQRNFDITDWPDSFGDLFSGRSLRGGGQTLRISAEPGQIFETYQLSLSDPSLNDSFIGGSLAASFARRRFNEFNENRTTLGAGLNRRFGDRWNASLNGQWQSVRLFDLEPQSTTEAFAFEGTDQLTRIGVSVRRTTVPPAERFRPTRGSITRIGVDQVGALGGDFDFTKLSLEHSVFLSVYESFAGAKTVLRLRGEVQWIPQGQTGVPLYERFYLGGQSFRGFEFRTISPKGIQADTGEPGDPVGGIFSAFAGVEIQQPIFTEDLAIAAFVDSGTVEREFAVNTWRVSAGVGLRLYVQQLSPAPLAFDFGFPIVSEELDEDRLFTFSVDLP
ncbi:MAG: outer membrane protein assembly factor BamA, partial [Planctomycetota bacterium]